MDGQLDGFEQGAQKPLRAAGEIQRQAGEGVEQPSIARFRSARPGSDRLLELGQRLGGGAALGLEFVVAGTQGGGECIAGLAVLRLADGIALAPVQIGQPLLKAPALCSLLLAGVVVHGSQVGDEELTAVRSEEAVGEKGGDYVPDEVFADVDHLGMAVGGL